MPTKKVKTRVCIARDPLMYGMGGLRLCKRCAEAAALLKS